MNKKIFILLIALSLAFPLLVFGNNEFILENPLAHDSFEEIIESFTNLIFWIGIILAPPFVLLGAFYIMTSAGVTERVQTGQRILLYTVIGFVIILLARAVMPFILMVLGV